MTTANILLTAWVAAMACLYYCLYFGRWEAVRQVAYVCAFIMALMVTLAVWRTAA